MPSVSDDHSVETKSVTFCWASPRIWTPSVIERPPTLMAVHASRPPASGGRGGVVSVAGWGAPAADTATIARVVFAAFADIHDCHRFPRDFPTEAAADGFAAAWNANPRVWGVVAEADGRIVGCNFLTERNAVRGVGPIAVLPD